MKYGVIEKGSRWGALECLSIEVATRVDAELGDDGEPTGFEVETPDLELYTLRCDCGSTFELWQNDYRGKRRTVDCGCGAGVGANIKIQIPAYITRAQEQFISQQVVKSKGAVSRNQVVREIIALGIEAKVQGKKGRKNG